MVKVWVQIWDFKKVFPIDNWQRILQACLQSGEKFQCTDNLDRFSCVSLTVFLKSLGAPWSSFLMFGEKCVQ